MKKYFLAFALILGILSPIRGWAQQITLTSIPLKLIGVDETVTITWLEPVEATLHYGTSHGTYSHALSITGTQSLTFVPNSVGIGPGVYFAVISNGSLSSSEFKLIIESPNAPTMRDPANNSTIQTASPEFRWDEVQGVPYYHIVVSDHEPIISRDENGNLQITGANIIWQAITSETHITYGSADPSGFFTESNGSTPPLMNGINYSWIVLNNYGNNPAYTSIVQGGVFTFTVNLVQTLEPPQLVAPANNDTISSENITFQWTTVDGAVNYQIYLYEFVYQDNSSSSILIWNSTTSNTSIEIPARQILKGTEYLWRVLSIDNTGNGYASETRSFFYKVPIGAIKISTRGMDNSTLPSVNIDLMPVSGSGDNISYVTSQNGNLTIAVQPGEYSLKASKEGYLDTTKTVSVASGDTLALTVYLQKSMHQITGKAIDVNSLALKDVQIIAKEAYSQKTVKAFSDVNGNFVLDVQTGTWNIWGHKEKYSNSDTVQVIVVSESKISLDNPLVLKPFSALVLGKVVNNSGNPILNANVTVKNDKIALTQQTNETGSFQFQISTGDWTLLVAKEGFISPAPRVFHVNPGDTLSISPDFVLLPNAGVISGFVFDGSKTVALAEVKAIPASGTPVTTQTDKRGYYSLSVTPGVYSVAVSKNGYSAPMPVQVNLQPGQTLSNVNFLLTPNPVFISGRVTNQSVPVQGAIVHAGDNADTTIIDGSYKIWVQPGFYQIWVTKPGYVASKIETLTVNLGENKENINFELTKNAGTISGNVFEGSNPISNTFVMAFSETDSFFTHSGDDGSYSLTVKPGTWKMLASKGGFLSDTLAVKIPVQAGQTVSGIDFNLVRNIGTVSGKVLDDSGNPLVNAIIMTADSSLSTVTDNNGNFSLQIEPGLYDLKATKTGYSMQSKSIEVKLGQTTEVTFALTSMGAIWGYITNQSSQKPINQAVVKAISGSDTSFAASDYTGEYRIHLKDGTYKLVFDKLGFKASTISKTIHAGTDVQLDVQLIPDPSEIATINGKVVADDNSPMRGVSLQFSNSQKNVYYSDESGFYEIKNIPTGFDYLIKPQETGYFFTPEKRLYQNLKGNKLNQNFIGSKYGDVTANGKITSYDASIVLSRTVGKQVGNYLTNLPRDSVAADVSGSGGISALDASLIFQYSAHLIRSFPVETQGMPKQLSAFSDNSVHQFSMAISGHSGNSWSLVIRGENMKNIFSTEWDFHFNPNFLTVKNCVLGEKIRRTNLAWAQKNGVLRLSTASLGDSIKSNDFIRIFVTTTQGLPTSPLKLLEPSKLQINEGLITGKLESIDNFKPVNEFALIKSYPNPFVDRTTIVVFVPNTDDGKNLKINLAIFNILGQKVKDIVNKNLQPGLHSFYWDGLDNNHQRVVNGIYFCKMQTEATAKVQKLIYMHK